MITYSKFKSFEIKAKKRILKVLQFGVKTVSESMPFGEDSAPLKDMTAIFAETSNNAEPVIIGYINKNQIAGPGERRLYSLKEDGSESAYMWLKNDETLELFGNTDNMVRYSKLAQAFNELKTDFNTFVSTYNSHTHVSSASGTPNSPTPASAQPSTADISPAKIDNIKTN